MTDAAVKPIYVLHGGDTFLRDAYRREIVRALIGEADPQTCVTSLEGTAELADVLDELRTLPFLAPHRVVIVRDADAFVSGNRDKLEKYLEAPNERSSLVLEVLSWPKTTRLARLTAKIGRVYACEAPSSGKLSQWITKAAAKRGKKLDADAAQLLAEWTGGELALLDAELEKLSLYAGSRRTITAEDVTALATASAGPAAFALANALTDSDTAAALQALSGMLSIRGEEFRATGMIRWHLQRVLRAQQLAAAGDKPEKALPDRLPPRRRKALLDLIRRRSMQAVQEDFRRLIRADLAMKSGTPAPSALQDLVVGLCT